MTQKSMVFNTKSLLFSKSIFDADMMSFGNLETNWGQVILFDQKKDFFLEDVVRKVLFPPSYFLKKQYANLIQDGKDPWGIMGIKMVWNSYAVRMTHFAQYYFKTVDVVICCIGKGWDANIPLQQTGIYDLTAVCEHIPFNPHQLRYQCQIHKESTKSLLVFSNMTSFDT